jgi:hypothetical protein
MTQKICICSVQKQLFNPWLIESVHAGSADMEITLNTVYSYMVNRQGKPIIKEQCYF